MEVTRPLPTYQVSRQSTSSEISTLPPSVTRLGPAPSLAGLRQFAAKLGIKMPGTQSKVVDTIEANQEPVEANFEKEERLPPYSLQAPMSQQQKIRGCP